MTGLQQLEAMLRGDLPTAAIATTLGFEGVLVEHGRAVFAGEPGPEHLNPLGTVHGGYVATLLDSALGCAVHTTLPAGVAYTSLGLELKFVRALHPGMGRVVCEGRVVHAGRTVATAEGELRHEESGKLLAHATTTCLILPTSPGATASA
jgi:uncharacterized protein (TIGR00369 family)